MNKVKILLMSFSVSAFLFSCQNSNKEADSEEKGITMKYMDSAVIPI